MANYLESFNSIYLRPTASGSFNQWTIGAQYKNPANIDEIIYRYNVNNELSFVGPNDSDDFKTQSWYFQTPNYQGNSVDLKVWLLVNGIKAASAQDYLNMWIGAKINGSWSSGLVSYLRRTNFPSSTGIFDWYSVSFNQQIPSGYFNGFEVSITPEAIDFHFGSIEVGKVDGHIPNRTLAIEAMYAEVQMSPTLPLYLNSDVANTSFYLPFYENADAPTKSGVFPMMVSGVNSLTSSLPMYVTGNYSKTSGLPFYSVCAVGNPSGIFPIYASGTQSIYGGIPYYLKVATETEGYIPIYSSGSPTVYLGVPFYTMGPLPLDSGVSLTTNGLVNYNFAYRNFQQYRESLIERLNEVSDVDAVGFSTYWYNAGTSIQKLKEFDFYGFITDDYLNGFYTRYNNGFALQNGAVPSFVYLALLIEIADPSILPNPFHPDNLPFFISCAYPTDSGIPFYTDAVNSYNFNYLNGTGTKPYLSLYLNSNLLGTPSGKLPFYTTTSEDGLGGVFQKSSGLNFYILGSGNPYNRSISFVVDGGSYGTSTGSLPIFSEGQYERSGARGITFIVGHTGNETLDKSLPFYVSNQVASVYSGVPLYVLNQRNDVDIFDPNYFLLEDGGIPLGRGLTFVLGVGAGQGVPFYLKALDGSGVSSVSMYLQGGNLKNSGVPMYTKAVEYPNKSLNLYSHGF